MPFRFHTKQTSFSNFHSAFPNVKPDANVNVYNNNNNLNTITICNNSNNINININNVSNIETQQHQFYDFFNDLNDSFNYCRKIFLKINKNREFIKKHKINKTTSNANNIKNETILKINDIKENAYKIELAEEINKEENDNDLMLASMKEESKSIEKEFTEGNLDLVESSNFEKINKIKQREIFLYSKQLSPLLDRLGRVMTDMGQYMFHNMKNNKLEE